MGGFFFCTCVWLFERSTVCMVCKRCALHTQYTQHCTAYIHSLLFSVVALVFCLMLSLQVPRDYKLNLLRRTCSSTTSERHFPADISCMDFHCRHIIHLFPETVFSKFQICMGMGVTNIWVKEKQFHRFFPWKLTEGHKNFFWWNIKESKFVHVAELADDWCLLTTVFLSQCEILDSFLFLGESAVRERERVYLYIILSSSAAIFFSPSFSHLG